MSKKIYNVPWLRKYFHYNGSDYCCKSEKELQEKENVDAFLHVIRKCEGTDGPNGYLMLFGGGLFDNFDDHPDILVSKSGYDSTAAGAYQILTTTWETVVQPRASLPDFSPESQDKAAEVLIAYRDALQDVKEGKLEEAVKKCAKEWASLPYSPYGQPVKTMEQVYDYFEYAGGVIENKIEHSNISLGISTII